MKRKRLSEEQIIGVLREHEAGAKTASAPHSAVARKRLRGAGGWADLTNEAQSVRGGSTSNIQQTTRHPLRLGNRRPLKTWPNRLLADSLALSEGSGAGRCGGSRDSGTIWLFREQLAELKNRGVADILIAVVDGLKGFPEAINAVFPETIIQTCIVHLIRHSLDFVSWKDRKAVMPALWAIYRAQDAEVGLAALAEFEAGYWDSKYPAIAQSWRRNWEHVIPFFAFPEGVRRIIYTTNSIEALNSKLRRGRPHQGPLPQ